jgi:ribonuclease G
METIVRDIVINSTNEETRIALCENNKLSELFIEQPDNERMISDIYKGRIAKIVPGIKGIFVDIGMTSDAFMHFTDFHHRMTDFFNPTEEDDDEEGDEEDFRSKKKPKQVEVDPTKVLKIGEEILVQIIKEPISNKGCRASSQIAIAGRFVVLIPNEAHIGVSKKIRDRKERGRLRNLAKECLPKGFGIIIRTVCEDKPEDVLKRDIKHLINKWKEIEKKSKNSVAPAIVYSNSGMTNSIMRDLFTEDINKVIVDSRKEYKEIKNYITEVAPELLEKLEYYKGTLPVFDVYFNIEKEIQRCLDKKVWMKNGGYLFIEHTEALTSIDINSGRYIAKKDQDDNSLKINIDAAIEIARQIRLRDIGGLIIIDFIDMLKEEYRNRVYNEFYKQFARDKAVVNMAEMSKFCLVEMTRQRLRPSIEFSVAQACPRCAGTGLIPSKETMTGRIERFIKRYRAQKGERRINIKVHPMIYDHCIQGKLNIVSRMMWKYWMIITLIPDETLTQELFKPYNKKFEPITLKDATL